MKKCKPYSKKIKSFVVTRIFDFQVRQSVSILIAEIIAI